MELLIDCIPCLLRQSLEAARMATDRAESHNKIMKETIKLLSDYENYKNSPELAREIHKLVRNETGSQDPYLQVKQRDLQAAENLYPYLKNFLQSKKTVFTGP
ncbi:ARMT1-like domain-containing protein [Lacrimispora sp. 38-1]|uniref:ARMT1-like domain-containing protein n=1 Tax=Lacrimispora sp. 38-1 TaxID=3125778 RepID=UPI003CF50850